jgi:hypothetical protein
VSLSVWLSLSLFLCLPLHIQKDNKSGGVQESGQRTKEKTRLGAALPPKKRKKSKEKKRKKNGLHCSFADTSPSQNFQTLELAASVRKLNFPKKPIIT